MNFVILFFLVGIIYACEYNGQHYKDNETFVDGAFRLICHMSQYAWQIDAIGCIVNGVEIPIGGRKRVGYFQYECSKHPDGTIELKPVFN
ncbi:unnamed protein product [Heligmosomoides polygyrus]|uniref:Abnormal cell migration protein 18-like fibronectin type I domain-containing protein n=1 Tax=Heligmosomoides polygyrus TaxID=6339 RepID=A0A3P7YJ00_HELPZ|nr:unnamed protein product [Heligmosomoides polygyrus]